MRGREQGGIDANGGAQSYGGTAPNKDRGIALTNSQLEEFMAMGDAMFGDQPYRVGPAAGGTYTGEAAEGGGGGGE